jgi:hypothetical protein
MSGNLYFLSSCWHGVYNALSCLSNRTGLSRTNSLYMFWTIQLSQVKITVYAHPSFLLTLTGIVLSLSISLIWYRPILYVSRSFPSQIWGIRCQEYCPWISRAPMDSLQYLSGSTFSCLESFYLSCAIGQVLEVGTYVSILLLNPSKYKIWIWSRLLFFAHLRIHFIFLFHENNAIAHWYNFCSKMYLIYIPFITPTESRIEQKNEEDMLKKEVKEDDIILF